VSMSHSTKLTSTIDLVKVYSVSETEYMEMTEESVKTICVKVGTPFKIRIWEDRTRGSRWTPEFDAVFFRLLNDDYDRTRNIRVSDIGMHYFEFLPMVAGKHKIVFEWRYGWKFSAENRLSYEVIVD